MPNNRKRIVSLVPPPPLSRSTKQHVRRLASGEKILLAAFVALCALFVSLGVRRGVGRPYTKNTHDFSLLQPTPPPAPRDTISQALAKSISTVTIHHHQQPPPPACPNPRFPFLSMTQIRQHVTRVFQTSKSQNQTIGFQTLGRSLLELAQSRNQTLLTFQIGGMDGSTNDPMHNMMVQPSLDSLQHWVPMVVEGAVSNMESLSWYYQILKDQRGLMCPMVRNYAISYETTTTTTRSDHGVGTPRVCDFCRFRNLTETLPPLCEQQPGWKQTQVGTVNCKHSEKVMKEVFHQCFVRDRVPCGTAYEFVRSQLVPMIPAAISRIALLQIDTEGYEAVLVPGLIREWLDAGHALPAVIHYESKLLRKWMRKGKNDALQVIHTLLRQQGYTIIQGRQDDLAFQQLPTTTIDSRQNLLQING